MEGTLATPLLIKQGDTFNLSVTWSDSTGAPVDTAGMSARMQLRQGPAAIYPVLFEFASGVPTTQPGGTITLGQGAITLSATAGAMSTLTSQSGVFDLQMTAADGTITTLLTGKYKVILDITV